MINDQKQRELALDPAKSFIVQAPAGSGKTTLLVERYLKLLDGVKAPEEILAITFTRKAAYQMQARVIKALQDKNDPKYQHIIQNPQRLRIKTIDAFCSYLVKCAPIVTKAGINQKIVQNQEVKLYYLETVRVILTSLTETKYNKYIETLLLHLDNDWQAAENLLIEMLASREQWLPHVIGLKNTQDLRINLEAAIDLIYQENLEICDKLLPIELKTELNELLEFSAANLPIIASEAKQSSKSDAIDEIRQVWQNLPVLLLTKDFFWRKKITKEQGFPAQATGCNPQEKELFKLMKQRMEELLDKFSKHEEFRNSLENLANSPKDGYTDQQWEMVEALLVLLPLLAAQLKVIFNENNITDYSEISMAAICALGLDDDPSQLALNLDYQLQHILVDEFQDTSIAQYRLIEKLISSWQQDDGHTLFVVGDPMQSIYRFREAEVGLFLRTQDYGIGMLKLQPLYLTMNFRATPNIVNWTNTSFARIFPKTADINFGAVPFKPSIALEQDAATNYLCNNDSKNDLDSYVKIELFEPTDKENRHCESAFESTGNLKNQASLDLEAIKVINIIKELQQKDHNASIVILVRARSHLSQIIKSLHQNNLEYQAHELESLKEQIVIKDLFALTSALFNPADRIAWLAILRTPWCGLSLADLHKIATADSELIWNNIKAYQNLNLSVDGQIVITKLESILTELIGKCGRILWRDLIEEAWLKLSGPIFIENKKELEYAQTYFQLLEDNQNNILKFNSLDIIQKKLTDLYPACKSTANKPINIHLMTIHKAKGLEFDHVIIPGINRPTRTDSRKLMLWFERPHLHGGSSLLLSSIESRGGAADPVYKYLRTVSQKKAFYETGRLLYVALTRAKKTAHLIGGLEGRYNDSFLSYLVTAYPNIIAPV